MQVEVQLEQDPREYWKRLCTNKLCRDRRLWNEAQAYRMTWKDIFELCGVGDEY